MAFKISSSVVSSFVVVNPAFSAFLISSCSCWIAVSASSTCFHATAVPICIDLQSISLSPRCSYSAFLVISPPHTSFSIASCTMLLWLGPYLLPSRACLHLLDEVVMWSTMCICWICLPVVAKGSIPEHWPFYFLLTSLMSEMLDVTRYEPHQGKLCLLCRGWYT